MAETEKNLKEAFAGESQAYQKYRAFAKKAEEEGFANIARLFRTTADPTLRLATTARREWPRPLLRKTRVKYRPRKRPPSL